MTLNSVAELDFCLTFPILVIDASLHAIIYFNTVHEGVFVTGQGDGNLPWIACNIHVAKPHTVSST